MRTLEVGRVVRVVQSYDGLAAGTIARVLSASRNDAYIQAAPGSKNTDGSLFTGHNADGRVRTRGWCVPRTVIKPTREKVANAREFAARYGA